MSPERHYGNRYPRRWKGGDEEEVGSIPPLLVPMPFLFSVHLHGMTFPFLVSDRNPISLDSFNCSLKTVDLLPCFPFRAAVFVHLSLLLSVFKLCKLSFA